MNFPKASEDLFCCPKESAFVDYKAISIAITTTEEREIVTVSKTKTVSIINFHVAIFVKVHDYLSNNFLEIKRFRDFNN